MRRGPMALLLIVMVLPGVQESQGAPAAACDLPGPLSDFWPKVIRDWNRRIPGLNAGPTQTAAWVSLVYGDPGGSDIGERLEKFIRQWSTQQEWNWVRSEIWKRQYSQVAEGRPDLRMSFHQNLILIGTPATNGFLARVLGKVGIRLRADALEISGRAYSGGDLLLVAILPSPFASGKYVLSVVGLSEEALLDLREIAFGDSDYALFRGRRLLEGGVFEKPFCDAWRPAKHPAILPDHRGWTTYERGTLRYHFDPARTPPEEVQALAAREIAVLERTNAALRFPRNQERIELYLYVSADEKFKETGDAGPVGLEAGASAIHRVMAPGTSPPAYPIALLLVRRNLGSRGSPGLRLALALAASPDYEGRPLEEFAVRAAGEKGRGGLRGIGDVETHQDGKGPWRALSAASFLRFLMDEGRTGQVKQLYLNSGSGSLALHFRDLMGESLDRAEERWGAGLAQAGTDRAEAGTRSKPGGGTRGGSPEAMRLLSRCHESFLSREDDDAVRCLGGVLAQEPDLPEAHLLLARIAFRGGDPAQALREARQAIALGGGDPSLLAWAHLTLGRAEAVLGRPGAAALELQDPSLVRGPPAPRLVADLWLENLGLSPNRKIVEEQLRNEAQADLQNFDWDSAEEKLKAVLATNPDSAPAHFALSEVYLSRHDTWAERALLSNELHPGTTPLDPAFYQHLADRAARELEKGMELTLPELSGAPRPGEPGGGTGERSPSDLDLFDPSLRLQGDSPDQRHHHFFRGRGYFFASDMEKARQELRLSLGSDGADQRIVAWDLIYLGFIDLLQGRRESARAYFKEAQKLKIGGRVAGALKKGLALLDEPGAP